jgi:hypothetical protein
VFSVPDARQVLWIERRDPFAALRRGPSAREKNRKHQHNESHAGIIADLQ